jgi:hypothetical protein
MLMERTIPSEAVMAAFGVALHCAKQDYSMILTGYARTDVARNKLVAAFMEATEDDDDVLVMLDADHTHPMDIVERLVSHGEGVVGALAFRRGAPFDPCFYVRQDDGSLAQPVEFAGLHEGTVVGTGAIAIRRYVFKALEAAGFSFPFFRYIYEDQTMNFPSEDMYFGYICEKAGISHFCDTGCVTPHLITSQVDQTSWAEFLADHKPEMAFVNIPTRKEVEA